MEGEDDWVMECESVGVGVVFILFLFFFFLRSEALLSYTRKQAAVKKKDKTVSVSWRVRLRIACAQLQITSKIEGQIMEKIFYVTVIRISIAGSNISMNRFGPTVWVHCAALEAVQLGPFTDVCMTFLHIYNVLELQHDNPTEKTKRNWRSMAARDCGGGSLEPNFRPNLSMINLPASLEIPQLVFRPYSSTGLSGKRNVLISLYIAQLSSLIRYTMMILFGRLSLHLDIVFHAVVPSQESIDFMY